MKIQIVLFLALMNLALGLPSLATAAEFVEGEKLLRAGRYDECAKMAAAEIAKGGFDERWWHLKIQAEMARGKFDDAAKTLANGQKEFPSSIALEFAGWKFYRSSGRAKDAALAMSRLETMIVQA